MQVISGNVTAPKGFVASGVYCGLRKNKTKRDLALIFSETACTASAVYTQNLVKGAPLLVTQEHLKNGVAKAIICNSGNANTCNADGREKAILTCKVLAERLNIEPSEVVVASTGVIGQPLNVDAIIGGIPELCLELSDKGGYYASEAIMTTDLEPKEMAVEVKIGGVSVKIGAVAKGSGMIHPNMATMLSFITTDCNISKEMLDKALKNTVDKTYNCISVDGDTSTNDMVVMLANGLAENIVIDSENEDFGKFCDALYFLSANMSKKIAKDGEGATKLIECVVNGSESFEKAKTLAKSVITSSLVKTAMFGADANWGRVLCALGYAGVQCDVTKIDVVLSSKAGDILVCKNGAGVDFSEEIAKEILLKDEIKIVVDLKEGNVSATAWGCDLSYDYVKINGDYRT